MNNKSVVTGSELSRPKWLTVVCISMSTMIPNYIFHINTQNKKKSKISEIGEFSISISICITHFYF